MNKSPVAIINAAGCGRRMGLNMPKCLVPILGQPMLHWQLQMLADFPDIMIVIGYQAEEVRRCASAIRPDAQFVVSPDYETTGTASSLSLAALRCHREVISIDGDLLVHPDDLMAMSSSPSPCIGVCSIQSLLPVYVELEDMANGHAIATRFHRDSERVRQHPAQEWTGLVMYDAAEHRLEGKGHVFEMIAPLLPCAAVQVRCREVDYPEEIAAMEDWLRILVKEGRFHG